MLKLLVLLLKLSELICKGDMGYKPGLTIIMSNENGEKPLWVSNLKEGKDIRVLKTVLNKTLTERN